jgi:hypothetical protein
VLLTEPPARKRPLGGDAQQAGVRALAHTFMNMVESLRPVRSDETVSCTLWHI